ncbi:MAG: transcriptional regulator [Clostridia bacterium]|nr:transcriptional regulator [Clostridia bacterium]
MKSITDSLISLEEANFALKCMREYMFTPAEAMESIESVVNRVRNIDMAQLTNHIINTRLSAVQRHVIRRCCLDSISANQCAQELGISLRAVYSARARGLEIIEEYLEPLVMYFRNLQGREAVPLFAENSLKILASQAHKQGETATVIKNIRTAHDASVKDTAKVTGVREKDILSAEKGTRPLSVDEIENYSRAFGVNIIIEFNKGKVTAKWKEQ